MLYDTDHHPLNEIRARVDAPRSADLSSEESDEALLIRTQARDETAFSTLMRRHHRLLGAIVSRVVHNDADVDDTLQEIAIEIWHRAKAFDPAKGKALGWIVTMTRRRAIDRVRRRQTYNRIEERFRLETAKTVEVFANNDAVEDAQHTDCAAMIKRVLATLPEPQRQALKLAYFHGLSQREIARKTGIPLGTIKTRLELAIRKVRAAVQHSGGSEEWLAAA